MKLSSIALHAAIIIVVAFALLIPVGASLPVPIPEITTGDLGRYRGLVILHALAAGAAYILLVIAGLAAYARGKDPSPPEPRRWLDRVVITTLAAALALGAVTWNLMRVYS